MKKASLSFLITALFCLIGNGKTVDVPRFNLKKISHYFSDEKTQQMLKAALDGDEKLSQKFVNEGANPNDEGSENESERIRPLHYAIAANNKNAVKILVHLGADPEKKSQSSMSAFVFAILLDRVEILAVLLDLRPIAKLSNDLVGTLMAATLSRGRPDCLKLLLDRGVPIDFPNDADKTPFMAAMSAQDYDVADWLISKGAAVVRNPAPSGMTPANTLQYHLRKYKVGSPTYIKILEIKKKFEAKGVQFPVPTPAELRTQMEKKK